MKGILSIMLVLVMCLGLLSAPMAFADAQETITIYNWGDANDIEADNKAIARFNEKYPNIKVVSQYQQKSITWADYITKLTAQIAAGDSPDMCLMAIEGVRQLLSYDIMMPLNDFIANDEGAKDTLKDVHQSLIDGLTIDGGTYFFPCHWNGMILYCNKQMFEEAGVPLPTDEWNWADFLATAQALTRGEGTTKAYGFDLPTYSIFFNLFAYSNGASTLSPDLKASNLTDPKVIEAYQFMHDMIWKYGVMPVPQQGNDPIQNLINGKVAMTIMGHGSLGAIKAANFDDLFVTNFPINDKENGTQIFGADGYGILKNAKNPQACWDLIMEFCSEQSQLEVAAAGVSNPARRSAANSEAFLAFPENAQVFYNILDQGCKILPAPVHDAEYENLLSRYYFEMMAQDGDVMPFMEAADKELNEQFAQE